MTPVLSILICGVPSRLESAAMLLTELHRQRLDLDDPDSVEILYLVDDWGMSIGAKRNRLAEASRGAYVSYIDDDDEVQPDYLDSILTLADTGADVLCFDVEADIDGTVKPCRYSLQYDTDRNFTDHYERLPCCRMVHLRDNVLTTGFADVNYGEDTDFARRIRPLLRTEARHNAILYRYRFRSTESEAVARHQGRR